MKTKRQTNRNVVSRKRWVAYAAAGVASATTMATAENAEADIYYSGILNQHIEAILPGFSNRDSFILRTAISSTSLGFLDHHMFFPPYGNANFGVRFGQVAGVYSQYYFRFASNVAPGVQLSGLGFLATSYYARMAHGGAYSYSQFLNPGVGILGFRFISPAEGTLHYAWARVDMTGLPSNAMTLIDWAYSDQQGFRAGENPLAVPEPGSLGLLAIGAMGLAMWRRRREKAAA